MKKLTPYRQRVQKHTITIGYIIATMAVTQSMISVALLISPGPDPAIPLEQFFTYIVQAMLPVMIIFACYMCGLLVKKVDQ